MADENKREVEQQDDGIKREKVRVVPLSAVKDFPNHPFQVKDDDSMQELIHSIEVNGVLNPVIARKTEQGDYELISGHRRKHACVVLGIERIPIIVREISRDEAVIAMVDSNLQRENILPSEKAFAYKMKMEAMKRTAGRPSKDNCVPMAHNFDGKRTREIVGEESGESADQVRRYIRLTELVPELLEMVDNGRMGFRPAVEISYLQEEEQRDLVETIDTEDCTPSLAQAIRMKELSREGKLDMDTIFGIMTEEKPNQREKIKIPAERFEKYFKRGTSPQVIEETIFKALDFYQAAIARKRSQDAR